MIVDTTFLMDVMRSDPAAVAKAKELAGESTPILVGAPSVFELYVGVSLSLKSARERERVIDVLRSLNELPLNTASASRAGLIYGGRLNEGRKVDPEDAMIAGIAIENNQPLLTRNVRDFEGIPDLKIEPY